MKPKPLTYATAFGWAFAAALLLVGLLELIGSALPATRTDVVSLGAVAALVFVLGSFAVLRVHAPDRSMSEALGLRPSEPTLLAVGLVLGLVLQGAAGSLTLLVERFAPTPSEVLALRSLLFRTDSLTGMVALIAVVCCVVPLVEELFYRGALFGGMAREHTAAGAAWATALCFALGRPDPRGWPALLLLAAALSHLRLNTGSVLPCIALHVGFSGADLAARLSGVGPGSPPPWAYVVICWLASALGAGLVQYLGARSPLGRRAREQDES